MAENFSLNIDTITNTVKRYNKDGVDGLRTNLGGRPNRRSFFKRVKKETSR